MPYQDPLLLRRGLRVINIIKIDDLSKVVNTIPNNVNQLEMDIDKFFDIDFFIKLYSNQLKKETKEMDEKTNLSNGGDEVEGVLRCKDKFALESHVFSKVDTETNSTIFLKLVAEIINELKKKDYDKIIDQGDHISIYEGFYLNENYVENLEYVIRIVNADDIKSYLNNNIINKNPSNSIQNIEQIISFEANFEPFNIDIIKNLASAKFEQSKLTYKLNSIQNKKIENIVKKIRNNKNTNENLLYNVGFNDKCKLLFNLDCLDLYIFCSYLYLNSSDLDLKLVYNDTEYFSDLNRVVMNHLRSSPDMGDLSNRNKEEKDKNDNESPLTKKNQNLTEIEKLNFEEISCKLNLKIAYRLVMFYPETRKSFKFFIKSDNSDERLKLDIDDLSKLINNYELPLREEYNLYSNNRSQESWIKTDRKNNDNNTYRKRRDANSKQVIADKDNKKNSLNLKSNNQENKEKRINFSIQMMNLTGYLKFSKLLFITPYIYIRNTITRNLYILNFHTKDKNKISVDLLKPGITKKLYYLKEYFEIFKFSFDDKFHVEEMNLYSGMVKFIPNTEFYIKVGDKYY